MTTWRRAATGASGCERRELASERAPAGRVSRPAASEVLRMGVLADILAAKRDELIEEIR